MSDESTNLNQALGNFSLAPLSEPGAQLLWGSRADTATPSWDGETND